MSTSRLEEAQCRRSTVAQGRGKAGCVVVAIGGNALVRDDDHLSACDQYEMAKELCSFLAELVEEDLGLVITHGNGPQVGFMHRRGEVARHELPPEPLDYCGASTQGTIGYTLQRALLNEFASRKLNKRVAVVLTQTIVDLDDPAFSQPTKPIGSFMSRTEAKKNARELGWQVAEDANRGYRRVVSSPLPRGFVGLDVVELLLNAGYVVIAAGGGGIPVSRNADGQLEGVEAVVDKDFASALLASYLGIHTLVLLTSVDCAYLDFGCVNQRPLTRARVSEATTYLQEGHFRSGSMQPKVEAIIRLLEGGGKRGIITSPANILLALRGEAGTTIVR